MLRPKTTEQVHQKNILQDPDPGKISYKLAGASILQNLMRTMDTGQYIWMKNLAYSHVLIPRLEGTNI